MPVVNRNYVQLGNIVKQMGDRVMSGFSIGGGVTVFTVHVSTKSASDQTLSSCSQKNINKLFNPNTEGFFPSLRANTETLNQQAKYWRVCVF